MATIADTIIGLAVLAKYASRDPGMRQCVVGQTESVFCFLGSNSDVSPKDRVTLKRAGWTQNSKGSWVTH